MTTFISNHIITVRFNACGPRVLPSTVLLSVHNPRDHSILLLDRSPMFACLEGLHGGRFLSNIGKKKQQQKTPWWECPQIFELKWLSRQERVSYMHVHRGISLCPLPLPASPPPRYSYGSIPPLFPGSGRWLQPCSTTSTLTRSTHQLQPAPCMPNPMSDSLRLSCPATLWLSPAPTWPGAHAFLSANK